MRFAAGEWQLEIDPARGGMVRALERAGRPILRAAPPASSEPFDSACFPLAPYVNRIAHGDFTWEGAAYHLAPNHAGQRHPLHGTAWLGAWQVQSHDHTSASLTHHHAAGPDWPFAFMLQQDFALSPAGLEITLTLHNTGDRSMPAGLGFHPWFSRDQVRTIAFTSRSVWLADADMLPTHEAPADALGDWQRGSGLTRNDLVDHCYSGWEQSMRIVRSDGDVLVEGDDTPFLHLYIPPGEAFFCAEPQSTMPDAVNRQCPPPLAPGASTRIAMRIINA